MQIKKFSSLNPINKLKKKVFFYSNPLYHCPFKRGSYRRNVFHFICDIDWECSIFNPLVLLFNFCFVYIHCSQRFLFFHVAHSWIYFIHTSNTCQPAPILIMSLIIFNLFFKENPMCLWIMISMFCYFQIIINTYTLNDLNLLM